ncbi:MAG: hypothetical protein AAF337_01470 [Pseudomonadota bacterium]
MANAYVAPAQRPQSLSESVTKLVRDNVIRVGVVLMGMTLFIAAAEAKTPINEIDLTNLPGLVSQVAQQSAHDRSAGLISMESANGPYVVRHYLPSDDFAAQSAPSNLLNSPAARFLANQLN